VKNCSLRVIGIAIAGVGFFGCNQEKVRTLQVQNDSLRVVVNQKEQRIDSLMAWLGTVTGQLQAKKEIEAQDSARIKLSTDDYSAIKQTFKNATINFQLLLSAKQVVTSYDKFLSYPLDKQIKLCNLLGRRMNMEGSRYSLVLQELLSTNAYVASCIVNYR
jgi:hypothetical protein